jgi:MraZ protein
VELRSSEASFLGPHVNRIDAKGRIAVPAEFRRALDGEKERGFYCLKSVQHDHLECGGGDFILDYKRMIRSLPPFSAERELLEEHILGALRFLPFDTEGRVVIPEAFRKHANLTERVLFQGRGETFVMTEADAAERRLASTRNEARNALKGLPNLQAGRP